MSELSTGWPGRRRALMMLLTGAALLTGITLLITTRQLATAKHEKTPNATAQRDSADGIGAPEARARGIYAAPGDGTVRFTSTPSPDANGLTTLRLKITNAGTESAIYTVELVATAGTFDYKPATTRLEGGATATVSIRLDGREAKAGHYTITARLSSDLLGDNLSSDTTVLDLSR